MPDGRSVSAAGQIGVRQYESLERVILLTTTLPCLSMGGVPTMRCGSDGVVCRYATPPHSPQHHGMVTRAARILVEAWEGRGEYTRRPGGGGHGRRAAVMATDRREGGVAHETIFTMD